MRSRVRIDRVRNHCTEGGVNASVGRPAMLSTLRPVDMRARAEEDFGGFHHRLR